MRDLVVALTDGARAAVSFSAGRADPTVVLAGADAATALARAVAGLAPSVSGEIRVEGRDVTGLAPGARQIGYVPRGGALLPHLTVRQNMEYLSRRRAAVHAVTRDVFSTLIYQLELGPVLEHRPHEITAQQRTRGSLARAMMSNPEAVVLERPDPAVCGPLDDLLARIESRGGTVPAMAVFADRQAPPAGARTLVEAS